MDRDMVHIYSGDYSELLDYIGPFVETWIDLGLSHRVKVEVAQSCLTLYNPMDYIVPGIPQARILEWVAFAFFRLSSQPRDQTQVSCIAG